MAYTHPQVTVTRSFRAIPTLVTDPMRAHISAGHAGLHRYDVASEKARLGAYDPSDEVSYSWPDKVIGSVIDLDYTKLYIDSALLRYFEDTVGDGGTVTPVSGYPNYIRSAANVFADHGDYTRDDVFLRPAKIGDSVKVTGVADSVAYELNSYIKGFKGETIDAVTGSAEPADSNPGNSGVGVSVDYVAGVHNNITLQAHPESFDGLSTGSVDETYTIEVISGSTGGDLTTAILRIRSASGNDDVSSKIPSAVDGYTAIGTLGLYVEFNANETASGSSAAGLDDAPLDDLVVGQKWDVHVIQTYTAPTPTASGTYTGTGDTTYIAECVVGGAYGTAKMRISTTTGIDVGGPVTVTASGTSFAVGSKGVRLALTGGTGVRKGDKWYIEATAAAEGAYQTLILGHTLPTALLDAADLSLELFMRKNLLVGKNRIGAAPQTNYTASQTEFILASGITYLDEEWLDEDGEPVPLEIRGGTAYVEYREWLQDYVGAIETATVTDDLLELVGVDHPDNPLGFGVNLALANGGGTDVRFTAVADPNEEEDWDELISVLSGSEGIYNLAPMTDSRTIQDKFSTHVDASSEEENGLFRGLFVSLPYRTTSVLASAETSSDGNVILASLSDDPETSGTQYTYLTITSGNAELEAIGVRPNDVVRFLYTTDGFDNEEFTEFPIEDVINESTVRLASAHSVAISVPQKIEIWRQLRRTEIAQDIADRAASFSSNRVCAVIPDSFESAGVDVPGYFMCAILAGLAGGAAPHQPLTRVELSGVDSVKRVTDLFSSADLDLMAGSGVWIVTADRLGTIYSRHAVTTDPTDINTREEAVRRNLDSIALLINRYLQNYVGKMNVTPQALSIIRAQIEAALEFLKSQNGNAATIGPQLLSGDIIDLRPHNINRDQVMAEIDLGIPYAMNVIRANLRVI